MDRLTEDDIVEQIVRDVMEGVDGTVIRSGVIGEIGCSWPLTQNERKVLRASARAQRITGAPLLIHPGRDETGPLQVIEILAEAGADLSRTIMGHLDRTVFLRDTLTPDRQSRVLPGVGPVRPRELLLRLNPNIDMPSDAKRMDDIAWISSEGYGGRVLVSMI